jgi:hypothetical protein
MVFLLPDKETPYPLGQISDCGNTPTDSYFAGPDFHWPLLYRIDKFQVSSFCFESMLPQEQHYFAF